MGVGGGGGWVGGSGLGVRVDVKEEFNFFWKINKKKIRGGSVLEGVRWGVGLVWGGQDGFERNVGGRG